MPGLYQRAEATNIALKDRNRLISMYECANVIYSVDHKTYYV